MAPGSPEKHAAPTGPAGPFTCLAGGSPGKTGTVTDLMQGRVTFVDQRPVFVGDQKIDWSLDPYRNSSWTLWFHSLKWVERILVAYDKNRDVAYLNRADAVMRSWIA